MSLLHRPFFRHVSPVVVLAALFGMASPSLRPASWDFEADEAGQIATGFLNEVGRWVVVEDDDNQVLAQQAENREPVLNVTLVDETSYKNLDLSVRIKAVAGENERGGGLIWRAKDRGNYYAVRYSPSVSRHNPREPNFRVYKVENGKLTQLDHAGITGDGEWHTLRITMIGSEIVGYLDGKKLLEAEDSTFLDVGRIGLWSKSDARSYFDDLTVSGR